MQININTPRIFIPLLQPYHYKGIYGGRGGGKSHFFASLMVEYALTKEGRGFRGACIRQVQNSLDQSVKELIQTIIVENELSSYFEFQHNKIITPNDGVIMFIGMQDHSSEKIKSLENFDVFYLEEAQTIQKKSWEMIRPTMRSEKGEIWCAWNPRSKEDPIDDFFRSRNLGDEGIVVKSNFSDNPFFPKIMEKDRLFDLENFPERYGHIWLGEYEPVASGALWSRANIESNRMAGPKNYQRIIVSIDPAVTSNENSDNHGIIVIGLGFDNRAYVLEDLSMRGLPRAWAEAAVSAYNIYDADCIVIEVNQGGDMVRHTIQSVSQSVNISEVRATKGKNVRSAPISAIYTQGKVSHTKVFNELESEMLLMSYSGYQGRGSPDRLDALVWGMTYLFRDIIYDSSKRTKQDFDPNMDYDQYLYKKYMNRKPSTNSWMA